MRAHSARHPRILGPLSLLVVAVTVAHAAVTETPHSRSPMPQVIAAPSEDSRWQGNDVLVSTHADDAGRPDMVGDSAGNLYVAMEDTGDPDGGFARVYRSADGGQNWQSYASFYTAPGIQDISLAVGEGTENWLLIAYRAGLSLRVHRINLDDPSDQDNVVIAAADIGALGALCIETDSLEYGDWYAYLAVNALSVTTSTCYVGFARSTDFGATWSDPSADPAAVYASGWTPAVTTPPSLAFGSGRLYLAYVDGSDPDQPATKEVFVRVSNNYGASFNSPAQVTNNSIRDDDPALAAVRGDTGETGAVVLYTVDYPGADTDVHWVGTDDGGASWSLAGSVSSLVGVNEQMPAVVASRTPGYYHGAYFRDGEVSYVRAAADDPGYWITLSRFSRGETASWQYPRTTVAVAGGLPADQVAGVAWTDVRNSVFDVYFDGPETEGVGTVVVDAEPDAIAAPWAMVVEDSGVIMGEGDTVLPERPDGNWTIEWQAVGGDWAVPDPVTEMRNLPEGGTVTFTGQYRFIPPVIASVDDVPGDQGHMVRLTWAPSLYDAPGSDPAITGYSVYRRQDGRRDLDAPADSQRLEGWDSLGWISAHGDAVYSYVAPTFCDSTAVGVCWSVFLVRATTADPYTYWDAPVDSGYSVDNLVPPVPAGVQLDGTSWLVWDPVSAPDLQHYNVYEAASSDMAAAELVGTATATQYDLSGVDGSWFAVTASDLAGNESAYSEAVSSAVAVPDGGLPARVALHAGRPNPFNPRTSIGYDLPAAATVRLAIYRPDGRLVCVLQDGRQAAGTHEVIWQGVDGSGRQLPSGVYLARLETDGQALSRRLTLVR